MNTKEYTIYEEKDIPFYLYKNKKGNVLEIRNYDFPISFYDDEFCKTIQLTLSDNDIIFLLKGLMEYSRSRRKISNLIKEFTNQTKRKLK